MIIKKTITRTFSKKIGILPAVAITVILSLLIAHGEPALAALEKTILINSQAYSLHLESNKDLLIRMENYQPRATATHYKGFVMGVEDSWARLSEVNGAWQGMVSLYGELHLISPPLNTQQSYRFPKSLVARQLNQIDAPGLCGVTRELGRVTQHTEPAHSPFSLQQRDDTALCTDETNVDGVCLITKLQLAFDYLFQQAFPDSYQSQALSLVNMLDGYYRNDVNIVFEAISTEFPDTQYFTANTDAYELIREIRSKMSAGTISFAADRRSLLHFISGRDFNGNILGLAYTGGVCSNGGYNVALTQLTSNNIAYTALIAAHELGHNLGAAHDSSSNECSWGYIMGPSISFSSPPTEFSSCSDSEIHSTISALPDPDLCFKYPVNLSITANSSNAATAPIFTEITSNYLVDIEYHHQSLETFSISGSVNVDQGTVSSAQLDGTTCDIAANNLSFTCTGNMLATSPLALDVSTVPNATTLIITTSIDITSSTTVTDMATTDNQLEETLVITSTGPGNPSSIDALPLDGKVLLSWTDNASNEQGFRIDRRLSTDASWTTIDNALQKNSTEYLDDTVTGSATYYYRVYAVNDTGLSLPSAITAATAVSNDNSGGGSDSDSSTSATIGSNGGTVTGSSSGSSGGSMGWLSLLSFLLFCPRLLLCPQIFTPQGLKKILGYLYLQTAIKSPT